MNIPSFVINGITVTPGSIKSMKMDDIIAACSILDRTNPNPKFNSKRQAVETLQGLLDGMTYERQVADGMKRRERISGNRVIGIVVSDNPKRAGSAAHTRFARYRGGMTVQEAIAAGLRREDVRYDIDRHNIVVV